MEANILTQRTSSFVHFSLNLVLGWPCRVPAVELQSPDRGAERTGEDLARRAGQGRAGPNLVLGLGRA
jgi:hypothetical protein